MVQHGGGGGGGELRGGGEQVSRARGPPRRPASVFLQLMSQEEGLGPEGGTFMARTARERQG